MSPEHVVALVERTTTTSGVPVTPTDPAALAATAVLVGKRPSEERGR